jgi:hypothetical protein
MSDGTPITMHVADRDGAAWAQEIIAREHYLHAPVDPRCRPLVYLIKYHYWWGAHAAAGPRTVGILMFGRPESTRCYRGGLTYGSQGDVTAGRAQFDRWEVLNLARVWFHPVVQSGGALHQEGAASLLPGFADRRGAWRSTLASWAIGHILARVGYDYLVAYPPVDCAHPYQIRAVLSYCDRRLHRGTIYRAAGFEFARTNSRQIETWYTPVVAGLTNEQDIEIHRLSTVSHRSQRIRGQRAQLRLPL